MRESWTEAERSPSASIARRRREHDSGRQIAIWDGLDWTTQVSSTERPRHRCRATMAFGYNGRAGIELLIAEL